MPNSTAPSSKAIRCGVMAKLLENKGASSRFPGMSGPPSGLRVGALGRSLVRLLAPLHKLPEQLRFLLRRRRNAGRRGGEKGLELVDRGLLRRFSGLRQRVSDRLREAGERRR